ncbi:MAG TPA: 2-C-methyl-D-erythritol 2,4-cyclodiphosphate synthase [Chloroflexota bacterium]|nr:2-C-methyl-D-erythritol 2,4-cyclodiphosphate synthase [Chloroflexota bacterium]
MTRVGIGYDIHRLSISRRLVLGGVEIPASAGLEGHSDADVLLHAAMDALLGAAALGDIGAHFPPDDDRFRGVSSLDLLARVRDLLARAGYRVVNLDCMVVAEAPAIGPYIPLMQQRIAGVLGIDALAIGIKATTNEGLGPEGRNEAISAQAVALVETAE